MLDEKYADAVCEIPADRLYNLLMAEAEWLALSNKGVDTWEHYGEALKDYVKNSLEDRKEYGLLLDPVPKEKTKTFKDFADWESIDIVKQYIKGESK